MNDSFNDSFNNNVKAHNQIADEGKWHEFLLQVQAKWPNLTDEDLVKAQDGRDHLVAVLEERYEQTKPIALQEVEDMWHRFEKLPE